MQSTHKCALMRPREMSSQRQRMQRRPCQPCFRTCSIRVQVPSTAPESLVRNLQTRATFWKCFQRILQVLATSLNSRWCSESNKAIVTCSLKCEEAQVEFVWWKLHLLYLHQAWLLELSKWKSLLPFFFSVDQVFLNEWLQYFPSWLHCLRIAVINKSESHGPVGHTSTANKDKGCIDS